MADQDLTEPMGGTLRLEDRRWNLHIVARHPEMATHRDLVAQAVVSLKQIFFSRYNENVGFYIGPAAKDWRNIVLGT